MKYTLPGFTEPTMVCNHAHRYCLMCEIIFLVPLLTKHVASNGVPFYLNSIRDILQRCLANPEIANNLVRFPVEPKNEFRYMHLH